MHCNYSYTLPLIDQTYYLEELSNGYIRVPYSSRSQQAKYQMPITHPISAGQLLQIKILAPPGSSALTITGKSGDWSGTGGDINTRVRMTLVSKEPTEFVPKERPKDSPHDGRLYLNDLAVATGGLNMTQPYSSPLTEAKYHYFVLYNPSGGINFQFVSLDFMIIVRDKALYKAWHQKQFNK